MHLTVARENFNKFAIISALALMFLAVIVFLNLAGPAVFYALCLLLIFYFFFRKREWILLCASLPLITLGKVLYFEIRPGWVYEMSFAEAFILAALAVFFIDVFVNLKISRVRLDYLAFFLAVYVFLSCLSFVNIIDFRLFIYGLKIVSFSLFAYFLSLNCLDSGKKIRIFLYCLAAASLILSAQIFLKFYETGLSMAFFFERNSIFIRLGPIALVSAVLVMILPIILAFAFCEKGKKSEPYLFIIFFLGALAVFLSLGKAAIASFLAGLLYLFFRLKSKRAVFVLSGLSFLVMSFIFFSSFFSGLFERLGKAFTDSSTRFRLMELEAAQKIITEHFWTGVGAGQQIIYYTKYLLPDYKEQANNFILQSFMDLGIAGFFMSIIIAAAFFKKARAAVRALDGKILVLAYGFIASLIAVFLNGMAEVTIFAMSYAIIFWLVAGVFSNLSKVKISQL